MVDSLSSLNLIINSSRISKLRVVVSIITN